MSKHKLSARDIVLSYGIYIAFIIICIVFAVLSPDFFSPSNIHNILIQTSAIAIVAIGQTLVILTGGIDISVGRLMGMSGILIGVFASKGVGLVGVAVIGIACGVVVGIVNGLLDWLCTYSSVYCNARHPRCLLWYFADHITGHAVLQFSKEF